jgi:hypothetical protein
MLILLLGAFFPNTVDGTMLGNPNTNEVASVPFMDVSRNDLLVSLDFTFGFMIFSVSMLVL